YTTLFRSNPVEVTVIQRPKRPWKHCDSTPIRRRIDPPSHCQPQKRGETGQFNSPWEATTGLLGYIERNSPLAYLHACDEILLPSAGDPLLVPCPWSRSRLRARHRSATQATLRRMP